MSDIQNLFDTMNKKLDQLTEAKEKGEDVGDEIHTFLNSRLEALQQQEISVVNALTAFEYTLMLIIRAMRIDPHNPAEPKAITSDVIGYLLAWVEQSITAIAEYRAEEFSPKPR